MSTRIDPYRILQVLPDASHAEIKAAYRRLARRYHPDRAPDETSVARMIELNQAWELVGDPVRRAAYDVSIGLRRPVAPPASAGSAGSAARATSAGSGSRPPSDHAGPPPGRPWGDVLAFGRYQGWSLGEIARVDPDYLEWLYRTPAGWQYRDQITTLVPRIRGHAASGATPGGRRR